MIQTQVAMPEKLDLLLSTLASDRGKKKEDIIVEAVEAYVKKPLTQEERLAMRRRAFGIWKDRIDLPDFDALRKSMNRIHLTS